MTKEDTLGSREVEADWRATYELSETAIAWAIEHRQTLEDDARNGCGRSEQFLAHMDRFFETGSAMHADRSPTDVEFERIVAQLDEEK